MAASETKEVRRMFAVVLLGVVLVVTLSTLATAALWIGILGVLGAVRLVRCPRCDRLELISASTPSRACLRCRHQRLLHPVMTHHAGNGVFFRSHARPGPVG
jgi:hypothetical protein